MIYGMAVKRLRDKNVSFSYELHTYSDNPQELMDNWQVLFSGDTIVSGGKWEQNGKAWYNNGVVTRDRWQNEFNWIVAVYPLHQITDLVNMGGIKK